jgi:hypothetical protein
VRLEGLGKLKKFGDLIGTQTHYLPVCSIVSQPTTLPCARMRDKKNKKVLKGLVGRDPDCTVCCLVLQ